MARPGWVAADALNAVAGRRRATRGQQPLKTLPPIGIDDGKTTVLVRCAPSGQALATRTEELRALTWDHVDLEDRKPGANPPVPPHVAVWRSVRAGGDTKTHKSRRTLALPKRCLDALRELSDRQDQDRATAGAHWHDNGLVFTSRFGSALNPANVRRDFRKAIEAAAGVLARHWTPRELRHSFVWLLSHNDIPLETISRLVGHKSIVVAELIYRSRSGPSCRAAPKPWTASSA